MSHKSQSCLYCVGGPRQAFWLRKNKTKKTPWLCQCWKGSKCRAQCVMEITVQILKLNEGHMVCAAMASGRNMKKKWRPCSRILLPETQRRFVQIQYTSYPEIFCTMCVQRTESLIIVPTQHLAQSCLMSYKKYCNYLSTLEMRIRHGTVQGHISRFVVLTPQMGSLSLSLVPSAQQNVDPGHAAHEYNSIVSAIYTYSAVNAFETSNPEETSTCVAFNKMCYSWTQVALLNVT